MRDALPYDPSMAGVLGFVDTPEGVEIHVACECGAIAVFRRVAIDDSDTKKECGKHNWETRVVHGYPSAPACLKCEAKTEML